MLNIKRKKISIFAKWAKITKPFTEEKHHLNDKNEISYEVKSDVEYANHLEMASDSVACILSYGNEKNGNLRLMRHCIFPTLRLFPNKTHNSLDYNYNGFKLKCNGVIILEKVEKYVFNGVLKIVTISDDFVIERTFFPAQNARALVEKLKITNKSRADKIINIVRQDKPFSTKAIHGHNRKQYFIYAESDKESLKILPNESAEVMFSYCANDKKEKIAVDFNLSNKERMSLVDDVFSKLVIKTPDTKINAMTDYAKLRASESIFNTKAGYMHSPGGGGFYSAVWTNDQCEYVNPFFAYLGYTKGIEQSINCYNLYKKYISRDKALISSIISEGDSIWHGAGDRGDSAMYAYGLSRFLLTLGDKSLAIDYLKVLEDCIEFTISKINEFGVVDSDSDELENRFESGKANLCTSTLAYDALISLAYIEKEFNRKCFADRYIAIAKILKENIEKYFGSSVENYNTYMYCKEETKLRSWIAMPLVVGIFDRAEETKNALLSSHLKVNEGLVTRSGEKTFWDRSTLYALRGLFNAGFADESCELLETYSKARLLGEHIPYAVEAFPEGNQAQLSAESALYVRVFTEGILGYRPVGFNKFTINPNLPTKWNYFNIENMFIGNKAVSIFVEKSNNDYNIELEVDKIKYKVNKNEIINLLDIINLSK